MDAPVFPREVPHRSTAAAPLTLGPFAFSAGPQAEQSRTLVQQRVWILHTDPVDVVHTELELTGQLCQMEEKKMNR